MDGTSTEGILARPKRIGVQFVPAGSIQEFDPGELTLTAGEDVLVESDRGLALGQVVQAARELPLAEAGARVPRIVRRAGDEDLARDGENRLRAREAHKIVVDLARQGRLEMKVIRTDLAFDGGKVTVWFFAEERIDFRALVRDLAQRLRVRVEMRQIGARDETKLVGGMGPCGRELCCSSWLREFQAVSVKMAKEQELSLNPSKLAGMCGRLKCCLRYEYDTYVGLRRELPRMGSKVLCVKGDGVVVRQLPLKSSVIVRRDEDGIEVEATLEDLVDHKKS